MALVSKSSGRNYIVKDGCSLFRLTMTEIIENRVMPGTLALTGVWEFPADTSAAIEFGALAYWDATSKTMKAAQSASEIPAGICVQKKESSGATVLVRLQDCLAAAGTPGPKGEKGDPGLGVPTPSGAGDAGKVPTVNEEGTGYELKAVGA